MLAGKSTTFVHTPFNLLEDTNVFYSGGISDKSCEMKTNDSKNILQITTGCAIAVKLTTNKNSCRAVSFPCIKNHAQWQKFAAESTRALHEWLEVKAHASSHWHFSNASTGTAAIQEGEDCIQCGDTHPTVSVAGSRGACNEERPEPTTPLQAQGYHCPCCFKCWKVGEEMPHGSLCTCPARSQLQEGIFGSDSAPAVLGFRMGVRVVNDAKIREQQEGKQKPCTTVHTLRKLPDDLGLPKILIIGGGGCGKTTLMQVVVVPTLHTFFSKVVLSAPSTRAAR